MSDELSADTGGMAIDNSGAAPTQDSAVSVSGTASAKGTLLDGDATDKPVTAPADWPEDWRIKLAGEDKSYLKTLDRFNSPKDLAKAYRDAQTRLSSGNLKQSLPDNPTPEELNAWRIENGVPESPDGYKFEPVNNYQWNEGDQAVLGEFAQYALENNIPASIASKMAAFYASKQAGTMEMIEEFDDRAHQEAEDTLRSEWGQEYRRNLNAIKNTLAAHASEDVVTAMLASRAPDGRKWGDHPDMLKVFASLARQANPTATIVPSNGFSSADDELSALEKKVGTKEYWADPKMQARYVELLDARDSSKQRGRAA